MKFQATKKELVRVLMLTKELQANGDKAFRERTNVHFATHSDGCITFGSTNHETTVTGRMEGAPSVSGAGYVNAADTLKVVKTLPDGLVTLTIDPHTVSLRTIDGADMAVPVTGAPVEVSPLEGEITHGCKMQTVDLLEALYITRCYTLKNEVRRNLMGVCLDLMPSTARFTATDGHRLARVSRPAYDVGERTENVIIPAASIPTILRAFKGHKNELSICRVDRHMTIAATDTEVTVKLVEGIFPNVDHVIPNAYTCSICFDRKKMLAALKLVASTMEGQVKHIRVAVDGAAMNLSSDEKGNLSNTSVAVTVEGTAPLFGINAGYLIDALKHMADSAARIEMTGPLSPIRVIEVGKESDTVIIMPQRLD